MKYNQVCILRSQSDTSNFSLFILKINTESSFVRILHTHHLLCGSLKIQTKLCAFWNLRRCLSPEQDEGYLAAINVLLYSLACHCRTYKGTEVTTLQRVHAKQEKGSHRNRGSDKSKGPQTSMSQSGIYEQWPSLSRCVTKEVWKHSSIHSLETLPCTSVY